MQIFGKNNIISTIEKIKAKATKIKCYIKLYAIQTSALSSNAEQKSLRCLLHCVK
uniref:Uncharacterized protein n=1 Tax=Kalanchoe fedtschenkoi TaxID=63787 RepID=A0A7N0VKA5_KALFE